VVPPSSNQYDYIIFRAYDILDLQVLGAEPDKPAAAEFVDPAIVTVRLRGCHGLGHGCCTDYLACRRALLLKSRKPSHLYRVRPNSSMGSSSSSISSSSNNNGHTGSRLRLRRGVHRQRRRRRRAPHRLSQAILTLRRPTQSSTRTVCCLVVWVGVCVCFLFLFLFGGCWICPKKEGRLTRCPLGCVFAALSEELSSQLAAMHVALPAAGYNKSSFFDNISCAATEVKEPRRSFKDERQTNRETFGGAAVQTQYQESAAARGARGGSRRGQGYRGQNYRGEGQAQQRAGGQGYGQGGSGHHGEHHNRRGGGFGGSGSSHSGGGQRGGYGRPTGANVAYDSK
jgi:hypothetical protein